MNYNMYGDLQLQHTVTKSEDTASHPDHHFTTNTHLIFLSLLLHGNGNYFSVAPKNLMTIEPNLKVTTDMHVSISFYHQDISTGHKLTSQKGPDHRAQRGDDLRASILQGMPSDASPRKLDNSNSVIRSGWGICGCCLLDEADFTLGRHGGWGGVGGGSREQPLNGLVSQNGGLLREGFQWLTMDSIVAPSATMSKHLPPSSIPWAYKIYKLLASPCPVWITNLPSANLPPKRMPEPKLQVQCIHTHQM